MFEFASHNLEMILKFSINTISKHYKFIIQGLRDLNKGKNIKFITNMKGGDGSCMPSMRYFVTQCAFFLIHAGSILSSDCLSVFKSFLYLSLIELTI